MELSETVTGILPNLLMRSQSEDGDKNFMTEEKSETMFC